MSTFSIARLIPKLIVDIDNNNMPNQQGVFRQSKNSKDDKFFGCYINSKISDAPTIKHNWYHQMVHTLDDMLPVASTVHK